MRQAGRILTTLLILFLVFNAMVHIVQPAWETRTFARLQIPQNLMPTIGIIELICVTAYAFPRTSVLGAILLTGYFGGAVLTNLRAGSSPLEIFFPIMFGALVWAGIYLRDERVRALIPWMSGGPAKGSG
jgi:hypothetical protein